MTGIGGTSGINQLISRGYDQAKQGIQKSMAQQQAAQQRGGKAIRAILRARVDGTGAKVDLTA